MRKVGLLIIIPIILLSFTTAFALIDEDKILDDVAKSINEHPDNWIDTGTKFVYCNDKAKMKQLRHLSWPEHESNLVFIYHFHTTFNYVQLQKPFEYDFEGQLLKDVRQAIQLYKLKHLMGEVGNLLEKKPEPKVEKEEIIKEEKKSNKL